MTVTVTATVRHGDYHGTSSATAETAKDALRLIHNDRAPGAVGCYAPGEAEIRGRDAIAAALDESGCAARGWVDYVMTTTPSVPRYLPTKYDSARDEVISILSDEMEGFGERGFGNVDAPTGYVSPVALTPDLSLDWANYADDDRAAGVALTYGVTVDDVIGWHVVISNDQGFVSVATYDTEEKWRAAIDALESAYAAWDDQGKGGE